MKKNLFLVAIFCLMSVSTFAQNVVNTTDFSGRWELDFSKSKLDERARIESMTMNVAQTNDDIKIETATKRTEVSRSDGGGMNRGGGGMMGDGMQTLTYSLIKGKAAKAEVMGSGNTSGTITLEAKFDGEILKLTQSRTMNTQMGEMTIITKENWTLSADGNTLTVKRDMETSRGTNSSEMIFIKKTVVSDAETADPRTKNKTTRTISGGVLNGKAINLVKPTYPAAARATRVSGAVNVNVTIDEQGNVIAAEAVLGHPLLRTAAVDAARASKFAPTMLDGVPVMVTGVIVYNFAP